MSVTYYQHMARNIPKQRKPQLMKIIHKNAFPDSLISACSTPAVTTSQQTVFLRQAVFIDGFKASE
jgi:hypothetical protein